MGKLFNLKYESIAETATHAGTQARTASRTHGESYARIDDPDAPFMDMPEMTMVPTMTMIQTKTHKIETIVRVANLEQEHREFREQLAGLSRRLAVAEAKASQYDNDVQQF